MEGAGASLNAKLALICRYSLMEMYQRIHLKMVFRSRLHGHIGCGWHYWVSKDASARWTKNGTSAWRCLVLWIKSMAVLKIQLDGIVHTQMKIILPFTWPQSVPKLYEILSFVEHKIRYVVYMWATKQFLVPIHIYIYETGYLTNLKDLKCIKIYFSS